MPNCQNTLYTSIHQNMFSFYKKSKRDLTSTDLRGHSRGSIFTFFYIVADSRECQLPGTFLRMKKHFSLRKLSQF